MRLRNVLVVLFALALAYGIPMPAAAQSATTGRIVGTVNDPQGAAVPGATVTASSPQLQGSRESVTDANGEFRFLSLPPGMYSVKAELSGFSPAQQDNISLNVNSTVTLPLSLTVAGVSAAVEVTAAAPVIDTTTPLGGVTATADVLNNLPMARTFYDVARLAPGVGKSPIGAAGDLYDRTLTTIGPGMYGGTGAENQYIIDGLNVTGMNGGEVTKTVNMDFVQEVQVVNTGLSPEYGRMNGGIINVVTQSGGNQFHGNVFGFDQENGMAANNSTTGQRPLTTTTILDVRPVRDAGGSLGGYVVKDRLWFFGAYDRSSSNDMRTVIRDLSTGAGPAIGTQIPSDVKSNLYAAKLTWRASNNHTLWVSTNGEPNTRTGAVFPIQGAASTWSGTLDRGAPNYSVHYDGVFGSQLLVRGIIGRDQEKQTYGGAGATTPILLNQTVTPNIYTGGFLNFTNQDFKRTIYKGDVTKFWGAHEIKVGGDYEKVLTNVERIDGGGGQRIYQITRALSNGGTFYYRHRFFVNDQAPGFSRSNPATWQIAFPLVAAPVDQNSSFYAQDNFKVMPNLSINYGIRWERQKGLGRNDYVGYDMNKSWAPRISAVWDPTKAARGKVFVSWGRYYNNIPLDMNIREFGGELECFCNNLTSDPSNLVPDPTGIAPASSLRGGIESSDPSIKGMYSDEWTGGVEWELPSIPHTSVGAKLIYRSLGRAIEDFLQSDGNFRIGNPSEGTFGVSMGSFSGEQVPAPAATRKSTDVELTLRKRYSDNWQFLASYVWERLRGNYDGQYEVATGQLDPGINSAYDYADFMVNSDGILTSQRQHQLKLDGSYTLSKGRLNGLSVGASFHWFSGLPLTAYGYSAPYANWEYFLVPRGSLGFGPADYEGDLQVSYPIKLATGVHADVQLAVFNVFNRQAVNQLYQRWDEVANGPCGGPASALTPICNGDGGIAHVRGTITPIAQLSNPVGTSPNPDFLKAGQSFTSPRAARIGVRLTF